MFRGKTKFACRLGVRERARDNGQDEVRRLLTIRAHVRPFVTRSEKQLMQTRDHEVREIRAAERLKNKNK